MTRAANGAVCFVTIAGELRPIPEEEEKEEGRARGGGGGGRRRGSDGGARRPRWCVDGHPQHSQVFSPPKTQLCISTGALPPHASNAARAAGAARDARSRYPRPDRRELAICQLCYVPADPRLRDPPGLAFQSYKCRSFSIPSPPRLLQWETVKTLERKRRKSPRTRARMRPRARRAAGPCCAI